jgi:type II secretory pathway pseudopilin PulG
MYNNKKSFTLIEILISIGLFSIIIVFLYQSLDMTQKSNDFYSKKLIATQNTNQIKKILFLDFIHSSNISIDIKNDILRLKSTNYYHNPFYNNITYLVTKDNNLARLETLKPFDKNRLNDNYFDTSYIDILDSNITKFKISKNKTNIKKDKIAIYLEKKNGQKLILGF